MKKIKNFFNNRVMNVVVAVVALVLTSCSGESGDPITLGIEDPNASVNFVATSSVTDNLGNSQAVLNESSSNGTNLQQLTANIEVKLEKEVVTVSEFSTVVTIASATELEKNGAVSTMTVTLSDGQVETLTANFPTLTGYPYAELVSATLTANEIEAASDNRIKVTSVWECQWYEKETGKRGTIVLRPFFYEEKEAISGYDVTERYYHDGDNRVRVEINITRLADGKKWNLDWPVWTVSSPGGMVRLDVENATIRLNEWRDNDEVFTATGGKLHTTSERDGFKIEKTIITRWYDHKWQCAGRPETDLVGPNGEITMQVNSIYFTDPETGFSKEWVNQGDITKVGDEIVDKGMSDIHIESGELGRYIGTHVMTVEFLFNGEVVHRPSAETNLYKVEFN